MHNSIVAPISELELRAELKGWLTRHASNTGARMYEEMCVDRGAARIDLALVNDRLEAYELKSDHDNFSRMHGQIHAYNRVFDRLWIVIGSSHVQAALAIVPRWWGILIGQRNRSSNVELEELRPAALNPSQDGASLASLLWRDETINLMREHGMRPASRANRTQLAELLADTLELSVLRGCVARCLLERTIPIAAIS